MIFGIFCLYSSDSYHTFFIDLLYFSISEIDTYFRCILSSNLFDVLPQSLYTAKTYLRNVYIENKLQLIVKKFLHELLKT